MLCGLSRDILQVHIWIGIWTHQLALLKFTCLCFISSFFSSRKADGIPAMFSCALNSSGHSSPINSLAFFPFKNPVRLICIILESGFCKEMWQEEIQVIWKNQTQISHFNFHNLLPWGYSILNPLLVFKTCPKNCSVT